MGDGGGGGEAYSFVACLSHLTVSHAFPFEGGEGGRDEGPNVTH